MARNWDKLLPYLLFAYREVPQASTGFSPFELLYGRKICGPLDVLKESWAERDCKQQSVLQHFLTIRNRPNSMASTVEDNMTAVQHQQKKWYNQHAKHRTLQVGDSVLVLLPTANDKLHAAWQARALPSYMGDQ